LYELNRRKPIFKDNLKKGFESILQSWQQEFFDDLSNISTDGNFNSQNLDNYRTKSYSGRPVNMLIGFEGTLGSNDNMLDTEIYFSHREARKRFFRSGGYNIRYRNTDDFESIEFGLSNDYLFYRINPNLVLNVNHKLCLVSTAGKIFKPPNISFTMR
jgi:hypothetical protein